MNYINYIKLNILCFDEGYLLHVFSCLLYLLIWSVRHHEKKRKINTMNSVNKCTFLVVGILILSRYRIFTLLTFFGFTVLTRILIHFRIFYFNYYMIMIPVYNSQFEINFRKQNSSCQVIVLWNNSHQVLLFYFMKNKLEAGISSPQFN